MTQKTNQQITPYWLRGIVAGIIFWISTFTLVLFIKDLLPALDYYPFGWIFRFLENPLSFILESQEQMYYQINLSWYHYFNSLAAALFYVTTFGLLGYLYGKIKSAKTVDKSLKTVLKEYNKSVLIGFLLFVISNLGLISNLGFSFIFLGEIIGPIFGINGLVQIRRTHEKGMWLAILTVVIGLLSAVMMFLLDRMLSNMF